MAKVLSQQSSFLRVGPILSHNLLEQLLKLDEKYRVYCSHCHWNYFWENNRFFVEIPIFQKLSRVTLLMKFFLYRMVCLYRQVRHGRSNFRGKDDSCHSTLAIYTFNYLSKSLFLYRWNWMMTTSPLSRLSTEQDRKNRPPPPHLGKICTMHNANLYCAQ